MKRTEDKIRRAFENATPNVLDTVLSQSCEEKGTVIPMTEKKKNRFKFKEFAATAAAVVLLFGVGYFAAGMIGSQGEMSGSQIDGTTGAASNMVDRLSAQQIALDDAFTGELAQFDFQPSITSALTESEDSTFWDITVRYSNLISNYQIDGYNGTILNKTTQTDERIPMISWQTARDNALWGCADTLDDLINFEFDLEKRNDVSVYDISFDTTYHECDYIIDAYTGHILNKRFNGFVGGSTVPNENLKSYTQCIDIALNDAGVSRSQLLELDTELKSNSNYEIEFKTESGKHSYLIEGATGSIVLPSTPGITPPDGKINEYEAIGLAVDYFKLDRNDVSLLICEFDVDDGYAHYNVKFYFDGYEYECEVGAYSHEVRDAEKEPADYYVGQVEGITITAKKALELAVAHFGVDISKITDVECDTESENGKILFYEISFSCNGYEYECDVDYKDGTIRNAEKERND